MNCSFNLESTASTHGRHSLCLRVPYDTWPGWEANHWHPHRTRTLRPSRACMDHPHSCTLFLRGLLDKLLDLIFNNTVHHFNKLSQKPKLLSVLGHTLSSLHFHSYISQSFHSMGQVSVQEWHWPLEKATFTFLPSEWCLKTQRPSRTRVMMDRYGPCLQGI